LTNPLRDRWQGNAFGRADEPKGSEVRKLTVIVVLVSGIGRGSK